MGRLPHLITDRLILRLLNSDDLASFVDYRNVPEVARYQGWSLPYLAEDAAWLLAGQSDGAFGAPGRWFQLAIVDRVDGMLHGDCAVRMREDWLGSAELAITLTPTAQRRALAAEALRALIDHLVDDHAVHRLIAEIDARNLPARRLVDALGLRLEAQLVDADWHKGEWTTVCVYAVLASEWRVARPDRDVALSQPQELC
jgi:RimJ/RimL family protein N-acetyltransferase